MKIEFWTLSEKQIVFDLLSKGDSKAINAVFSEIDRLECLCKDQEIAFNAILHNQSSKTFKSSTKIATTDPVSKSGADVSKSLNDMVIILHGLGEKPYAIPPFLSTLNDLK